MKHLVIQIVNPICTCRQKSISWGMTIEHSKTDVVIGALRLTCTLCGTKVYFPYEKLTAVIKFDNPYPDCIKQTQIELPDGSSIDGDALLTSLEKQMQGDV